MDRRRECRGAAPLCRPVKEEVERRAGRLLRFLPVLPREDRPENALEAFRSAPQFAQVEELPRRNSDGGLRVLLIGPERYYRRQAAVYLSALCAGGEDEPDGFWEEDDDVPLFSCPVHRLALYDVEEWLSPPEDGGAGMVQVVLSAGPPTGEEPEEGEQRLLLEGTLSEELADRLDGLTAGEVFLSVAPEGALPGLVDRLRFEQGFSVCRIGTADEAYRTRLLLRTAGEEDIALQPGLDTGAVLAALRRFRGERFCEGDFARLLRSAAALRPGAALGTEDLCAPLTPFRLGEQDGLRELESLVGLGEVKRAVRSFLAGQSLERRRREAGLPAAALHRNLAFAGAPGTCKSVVARLVAQILREQGVGTGAFVEAGREQLIGQYLGQTSPKVAELFRRARGGVLFLDEAGALLPDGHDPYAKEAVTALVRHMELSPETMVIFATYPGEMEALLSSDPGLSSRVSRVISFPSYSDGELCAILSYLADRGGYRLPEGAEEVAAPFFAALRRRQGERFGNGREARRLLEGAVSRLALRAMEEDCPLDALSREDLAGAAEELLSGAGKEKRAIGF